MNFDCENITYKTVSTRTEEKKSGNKDDDNNNCDRNTSEKIKSLGKTVSGQNNENMIRKNETNTASVK